MKLDVSASVKKLSWGWGYRGQMPTRVSALVVHDKIFCPPHPVYYAPEADILEEGRKNSASHPFIHYKMMKYLDTPDLQCCFSFCLYLQEKSCRDQKEKGV